MGESGSEVTKSISSDLYTQNINTQSEESVRTQPGVGIILPHCSVPKSGLRDGIIDHQEHGEALIETCPNSAVSLISNSYKYSIS